LPQKLGPLYRLQRCGGVDQQCHLEILCNSTKVVIETNEMARHMFNVDIRHKPEKDNVVCDALNRKHQLKVVYVGETKLQKEI
jgi:hypothetical protein